MLLVMSQLVFIFYKFHVCKLKACSISITDGALYDHTVQVLFIRS